MKRVAIASFCLALALLTYFQFPGHTWLQQDTQIYAPILEHLRDPAVLRNEILVQQPHVAYSLYDEVTIGLRAITGLGFREVLAIQQIATRALGIWGLLLLAESMGLSFAGAAAAAAICSLGAIIAGPSVLTVEYEAIPRAFAVPLLICAMGLAAHARYRWAGIAAAAALLYHPPTALPFWIIWAFVARFQAVGPFAFSAVVLFVASRMQSEAQNFLAQIPPWLEAVQRMRASYVYISTWPWQTIVHHLVVFALLLAAFWRVRQKMVIEARAFLIGLPAIGLLSMPLSWLLLEHWKWGLVPQVQPMRTLLFATLAMQLLAVVAGVRAGRSLEGAAWFTVAFLPAMPDALAWKWALLAIALGAAAALTDRWAVAIAAAAFFVLPWTGVVNYPQVRTVELGELSQWARANTPSDAVFLFADARRGLDPGVFRTEALRAIYVDWKGGGQVNYLSDFAEQWWFRWQQVFDRPIDLARYEALGVRYVVLRREHRVPRRVVYENGRYVVYEADLSPQRR
jgi:hypothetical protein